MKKLFHSHPNAIIIALVLIFLGVLVALYAWVINDIVLDTHRALSPSSVQAGSGFNLTAAAALDLRGLFSGATPPPAVATTTPTTTAPAAVATPTAPTTQTPSSTFDATSSDSIAQQLSGLTQSIANDNPNVVPVIFSNLTFTSIKNPITVDVSVSDASTAEALNNALEHSSHFTNVQVSSESTVTSGRITYSITFLYIP